MKKHKIAVAAVSVVFLTGLWGGVAGGQARADSGGTLYWSNTPGVWESWMGPEPPPGSSYLPDGYQPGDTIPCFSPNAPYSDYDNRGTEPLNSGVGVPEPGSLLLLAGAQERPDVGLGYGYEWWLGGAPPPPGVFLPDPRWPWLGQKPVPISDEYLPPVPPPWYQRPHFAPGDPYSAHPREWYVPPDYFPYWYRMGDRIPWFSPNDPYFYLPELLPLWYQARWFSPNDTESGYDTGGSDPFK